MATTSSSTSQKDKLVYFKKKLERATDDDTILLIIHKLSKFPITLDLLQGTGAGKIMRVLSKKSGLVGNKASALLNKWRDAVADSQKSSEKEKQSKHSKKSSSSKEKHLKENHTKEKYFSTKMEFTVENNKHSKDIHIKERDKHDKEKNNGIKDKHIKDQEKLAKEKLLKSSHKEKRERDSSHSHRSSSNPNKNVKNESNTKENNVSLFSEKNLKSTFHSDTLLNFDSLNDDCAYNPEHPDLYKNISYSVLETGNKETVSYEPTPKKVKLCETTKIKHNATLLAKDKNPTLNSKKEKNEADCSQTHKKTSSHKKDYVNINKSHKEKVISTEKLSNNNDKKKSKNKDTSNDSVVKKSKKIKIKPTEAFTQSEALFEDCLNFNDIVHVKKKKVKKSSTNSSTKVIKPPVNSEHKQKYNFSPVTSEHRHKSKNNFTPPKSLSSSPIENGIIDTLTEEFMPKSGSLSLKSQEVNLLSTLPQTRPNYRPLPHKLYDGSPVKKKAMTDEEAIKFTSSRKEKTAVYSGRKNCFLTEVPTLFECCTRILIENIDDIEYMGVIPYFLLESMLKRCSPTQLYRLEHYNPYLLEDTNVLWEVHCKRDYRNAIPQESETYRELYWRIKEEQEQKLRNVTANISASIANSNPVRKAKLAYIDSVVKPPRDVARRQMKNGTALPTNLPVKAGPPSKATPRPTAPAINAASTSKARIEIIKPQKPRVAPLMAKTLKSMKQCFRR